MRFKLIGCGLAKDLRNMSDNYFLDSVVFYDE